MIDDDNDLTGAQDITIDGSVYVLNNNGDVYKYYAGAKAEFYINDAPFNAFKNPSVIYTNEKLDDVYILDSQDSRVLVFAKDAQTGNLNYTSQFMVPNMGELRDIYVDADDRKLFLLTESKIIEVAL